MRNAPFAIALLLVLAASGSRAAQAAGAEIDCARLARSATPEITTPLQEFVHAAESESRLAETLNAGRLRRQVENLGSNYARDPRAYIAALCAVDQAAERAPLAIYRLAQGLELAWERTYLERAAGQRLNSRSSAQIGLIAGLSVLGLASLRNPATAPRYFRVVNTLLPAASTLGAAALAERRNSQLPSGFPPAPAQIMSLGLPTNADAGWSERQAAGEIITLATSLSAGSLSSRILKLIPAIRTATATGTEFLSPANMGLTIASIIATGAVERKVRSLVFEKEFSRRREPLEKARSDFRAALAARDLDRLQIAADKLVPATLSLSTLLNAEFSQALGRYLETSLSESSSSALFALRMQARTEFLKRQDTLPSELSSRVLMIRVLLDQASSGQDATFRPDSAERRLSRQLMTQFEKWLVQNPSPRTREELLSYFMRWSLRRVLREFADLPDSELQASDRNPECLLLHTLALLESASGLLSGSEYEEVHSEYLTQRLALETALFGGGGIL